MNLSAEIVNPLEQDDWNELVTSAPGYSFFHSANWAGVLHDSYGYKPVYSVSMDKGRLMALIPCMEIKSILTGKRGVTLPFTDCCEPLINDRTGFRAAMALLTEYGKRANWRHIEFRGGRYFPEEVPCSEYYMGHTLSLSGDEETVLSGFRQSTGRNIRKALKMGVQVEVSSTREALGEFCRLNCLTRKRHGLPPQPYYFFENIYRHVISKNLGTVVLASFNKRVIAGAVFFHLGARAFYKYGASDMSLQDLRANNLVMWEAMRWYMKRGCETLCFGRTEPDASGLRQYKAGWGAREQQIKYFRYNLEQERVLGDSSPVAERYYRIFHALPLPLSKIAGLALYRHVG